MSRVALPLAGAIGGLAYSAVVIWASGWVPTRGPEAVFVVFIATIATFMGWNFGKLAELEDIP